MNNSGTPYFPLSVVLCAVTEADMPAANACAQQLIAGGISPLIVVGSGNIPALVSTALGYAVQHRSVYIGVISSQPLAPGDIAGFAGAYPFFIFSPKEDGYFAISRIISGTLLPEQDTETASGLAVRMATLRANAVTRTADPKRNSKIAICVAASVLAVFAAAIWLIVYAINAPTYLPHEPIDTSAYAPEDDESDNSGLWQSLMDTPSPQDGEDIDDSSYVEGDYIYRLCVGGDVKGLAYIDEYTGNAKTLRLPETLGGKQVVGIETGAFRDNTTIESVTMPDGFRFIGSSVFSGCTSLKSVDIPDSVTSIGSSAFSKCSSLEAIKLPASLNQIGSFAFSECSSISSVAFPKELEIIETCAFKDCAALTSVDIPNSVTKLDDSAFSGCTALKSACIGKGITVISPSLFYKCESLSEISYNGSINEIGDYAFYGCGFSELTVPESVEALGKSCFAGCASLKEIALPASLELTSGASFCCNCPVISKISVYGSGSKLSVKDNVLFSGDGKTLIKCPAVIGRDFTVPDGTGVICSYAFSGNEQLGSVTVPDSVTMIDAYAFHDCPELKKIEIGGGVDKICDFFFYGCDALDKLTLSAQCEGYILENGTLTDRRIGRIIAVIGSVPEKLVIPEGITELAPLAYYAHSEITSISLPSTMSIIGNNAFCDCTALQSVSFGGAEKVIDYGAFSGCTSLESAIMPDSVEKLGSSAFSKCEKLKDVHISEKVTCLEQNTFFECVSLNKITIPTHVEKISYSVFGDCASLEYVYIPDSVTELRAAFKNCTSLKRIVISDNLIKIDEVVFEGCTALEEIYYPSSVEFHTAMLAGCTGMRRIYYGGSQVKWQTSLRVNDKYPVIPEEIEIVFDSKKPER